MNEISKKEAMNQWLESNPGKTKRDWLLEERCGSTKQRQLLKDMLYDCKEETVRIPASLYLDGDDCIELLEKGHDSNHLKILQRFQGLSQTWIDRIERLHKFIFRAEGIYETRVQFDFSLNNKFYLDLDESQDSHPLYSSPLNQWRECLLRKLREIIVCDKGNKKSESEINDIASLFIHSNEKLMSNVPLYDFSSQEFLNAYKEEMKRMEFIRVNGLDRTPPSRLWPMNASVPYSISSNIHQLTLMEFINRLTQPDIYKGGRFVIAFINAKDNTLIFPDEAARIVNKYGEIYSGYYEEFEVTYPGIMDFNKIINTYPLSQPLVARTKRSGSLPVINVVPFEYNDFAFNAIVVDHVIENGVCSTVKKWLLDSQDKIAKSTDYEAQINAPRTDLYDLHTNPSSETDFTQSPRRKLKKSLKDLYNQIANENSSDS